MQHLPARRQKKALQKMAHRAMSAYQKFSMKCLQWDDATSNAPVNQLHLLIIATILRGSINEANDLYASPISTLRSSPHLGPLAPETAAKLDESFLHHLLALTLKARTQVVKFVKTATTAAVVDSNESSTPLVLEYCNTLFTILYAASTRLQRIAVRMLKHILVPILPINLVDMNGLAFASLSMFQSPYSSTLHSQPSSSVQPASSVSAAIVGGLISFVGDLMLRTSPQQHNLKATDGAARVAMMAAAAEMIPPHFAPIEPAMPQTGTRNAETPPKSDGILYQTIVHLSVSEFSQVTDADSSSSASQTAPSPQSITQAFVERHSTDVLENLMQRFQVEADARANGDCKEPNSEEDRPPIGKKLDSAFQSELRSALETRGEAAVFTGGWERAAALGKKIAGQGLVTSIRELQPEPHAQLNAERTRGGHWNSCQFGGRQALEIGADVIALIRSMVQSTGEWANLTQNALGFFLHFLDAGVMAVTPTHQDAPSLSAELLHLASSLPSPLSENFVAAFGSVLVIGGLGLDVPRVGAVAALTVKEVSGEGQTSP